MNETTWHSILFWIMALIACGSAVLVVLTSNIVRMAAWLLVSLSAVAGLFFLMGADFVGAAQLLIYVGGTLVLLIFGVMLTASGPLANLSTPSRDWLIAAIVGSALMILLILTLTNSGIDWSIDNLSENLEAPSGKTTMSIGLALLGIRENPTASSYLLPFEIASVHLLVVLIGAAYLARAKRRSAVLLTQPATN